MKKIDTDGKGDGKEHVPGSPPAVAIFSARSLGDVVSLLLFVPTQRCLSYLSRTRQRRPTKRATLKSDEMKYAATKMRNANV